jgi:hypothetical protein
VVVEPQRGGALVVLVLEHCGPRWPGLVPLGLGLGLELLVETADPRVAGRDVVREGQVPGLGVPVALLGIVAAMQVANYRNRPGVGTGGRGERRMHVPSIRPAGRVGPVQGGIDRQQVRQIAPTAIDQAVDPGHADRPIGPRLDSERGVVEGPAMHSRAVAPHCGGRHARRQDLLPELADCDGVSIDTAVPHAAERRHGRWDHEWCDVLGDLCGIQGAAGDGGPGTEGHPPGNKKRRPAERAPLEELSSGDHPLHPLLETTEPRP